MLTKINLYAYYAVKIYKNNPTIFFKRGRGCARPGSAFVTDIIKRHDDTKTIFTTYIVIQYEK